MDATAAQRPSFPRPGIALRLWNASRLEFSQRGYHGARVQGIARGAGCNVALLYRHWASKKALYLEVLQSAWRGIVDEVGRRLEQDGGAASVVAAYLDANLGDPIGARIIIREVLDGGPFLAQLVSTDPSLTDPIQRAARALQQSRAPVLHPDVESTVAVLSIGGLAALIASAQEATRPLLREPVAPERWREQAYDLLLHGAGPRGRSPRHGGAADED